MLLPFWVLAAVSKPAIAISLKKVGGGRYLSSRTPLIDLPVRVSSCMKIKILIAKKDNPQERTKKGLLHGLRKCFEWKEILQHYFLMSFYDAFNYLICNSI